MYTDFDSILSRLTQGRLWDFPGGIEPAHRKSLSNNTDIAQIDLPETLHVTVKQHIGVEGHVEVKIGQKVLKGQALTKSMNPFAVPVHAPTSGTITAIGPHVSAHPSGLPKLTIQIQPDGEDKWVELTAQSNYLELPKIKIVESICSAGVSGMGGAGFPTHIKASPKKNVEFLIINGVECEPYITSDDRLMREHAWQIRQGIDVLTHLLSPKQIIVAIEENKPEAIEAMQVACQENAQYLVCPIPTKYPAGGEKQLIQVLTNREVPKQGLPVDVGVIMQNVGTCFAIADAVFTGKPLIQRVVTLTGEALQTPQNVWALIGTPMRHLLEQAQYQEKRQQDKKMIMGGPMMGFAISSEDVPVVKTTNCILVPSSQEIPQIGEEQPCIRCGACADACPASLLPQQLFWHSKAKELDKAQEYNLFDCIECGACAFVCPSEIPLVHYYRKAKADIRNQQQEKDQADKARERFEARNERLQKEQQEREEKHRKAAEARKQAMNKNGGDAKDKIAAALARAKAKKNDAATSEEGPETTNKVSAAIARAKAKKEASAQAESRGSEPESKQDKVAAAIARAKAKREAANSSSEADGGQVPSVEETTPETIKKDKVAAAIARAKAKREATKTPDAKSDKEPVSDSETDVEAAKKTKVTTAVARAKAKRQASKDNDKDLNNQTASTTPDASESNPKQASGESVGELSKQDKIAQAIARAKAKRAAAAKKNNQDEK